MERIRFIHTIIFSTAGFTLNPLSMNTGNYHRDSFKIHMVYNNIKGSSMLKPAWGLSVWINYMDKTVLFDTGGKPSILWKNINRSRLNTDRISHVILSHNHWDHKNGLGLILEKTNYKPDVFIIESDYQEYREQYPDASIKAISRPLEITKNIWSTGELVNPENKENVHEQSLILVQNDSLLLLTGCSHTGIVPMAAKTKEIFPGKELTLVAGGFHLLHTPGKEILKISGQLKEIGVKNIAPSHCTGDKAIEIFTREWQKDFINLNLGDIYT